MPIVDELFAILGFKLEGESDAKRYEKRLKRMENRLNKFSIAAGRFAGIAAVAVASGSALLARSVINTSAEFEKFQATLETIEGSSEKAEQSMDWIAEFAKTTPFDVAQVTDSFIKLKAYGIDPISDDALRILGDTGSAMGKSLNQAVEAFADAATGEFERLKEFGIKAKTEGDNVTFAWTKNGEAMSKTVKKNSTEIRAFLLETMGDRFSGAMDRQSRTWMGMMSNLGDTWTDFQRRVGDAGFFGHVSGRLRALLDWLEKLDKDGTLDQWATGISNTLTKGAKIFEAFVTNTVRHLAFLDEKLGSIKIILGVLAIAVAAFFAPWLTGLAALMLALDDLLTWLEGGDSYIGSFVDAVTEGFNSLINSAVQWGVRIAQNLLAGLKTMGQDIKDWFNSILPDWMNDHGDATAERIRQLNANAASNTNRVNNGPTGGPFGVTTQSNLTQTINIEQNVQQATDAPGAAAEATGQAIKDAGRSSRPTRLQSEPAF